MNSVFKTRKSKTLSKFVSQQTFPLYIKGTQFGDKMIPYLVNMFLRTRRPLSLYCLLPTLTFKNSVVPAQNGSIFVRCVS